MKPKYLRFLLMSPAYLRTVREQFKNSERYRHLSNKMVDILDFVADKGEFTTEAVVHQFGFESTTAKRYLRQLTAFGYLEAYGENRNPH